MQTTLPLTRTPQRTDVAGTVHDGHVPMSERALAQRVIGIAVHSAQSVVLAIVA